MAHEKATIPEEVHAAVGFVVTQLLKAGKPVHMHDITALLHTLMEQTSDDGFKKALLQAVKLIAGKMN